MPIQSGQPKRIPGNDGIRDACCESHPGNDGWMVKGEGGDTPWKIKMEPTNQPFRKDNYFPNLHDCVPC